MTTVDIGEWDRWFETTGDEQAMREWCAAKEASPDNLIRWATIIEMNRIDRMSDRRMEAFRQNYTVGNNYASRTQSNTKPTST